jgi:hypothetical protein
MTPDRESAGSESPSEEARIASMSAPEFLASIGSAMNLTCANLWLVKAAKMGFLPSPIAGALALVFLTGGVGLLCVCLRNTSAGERRVANCRYGPSRAARLR